jgi:hypothetical protein
VEKYKFQNMIARLRRLSFLQGFSPLVEKVKIAKKKWLLLGIGLFLCLGAGLGWLWSEEARGQQQVKEELFLAQMRIFQPQVEIQRLAVRQQELKNMLPPIESRNSATRDGFFQSLETIEFDEDLFDIQNNSKVKILEIIASPPNNTNLEGIPCKTLQSSVQVQGNQSQILDFIRQWTEKFPTGVVEAVYINFGQQGGGPTPTAEPIESTPTPTTTPTEAPSQAVLIATATISLRLYTFAVD